MNTMWQPIEDEVDALVKFSRSLTYPILKSIRWNHRRVNFEGAGQVERDRYKLTYRVCDGGTRYALRYEFSRQRWVLEGLEASGLMDPASDVPPPRCFPPEAW